MTVDLHNLIEALRNELQQYGEMLALLDHYQQELATQRVGDAHGHSVTEIQAQSRTIQAARQRRQTFQQELARALQQPADSSLTLLAPLLPEQYRPLLDALVQENQELLQQVGERARQNQRLLEQSLEMIQSVITSLSLPDIAVTSCPNGSSQSFESVSPAYHEAVV